MAERDGAGRTARVALALLAATLLANCTAYERPARVVDPRYGVPSSPRVVEEGQPVPRGGGYYRVGEPYTIAGRTFVPREDPNYRAEGVASWYGTAFHGRLTANGEVFDRNAISAAHPTLPLPSYVRVTNLANRRSLIVRVNDRGPFHDNRVIDLSARSAELLGFQGNGLARVRVEYVGPASLAGSDDNRLLATLRRDGSPAPTPSTLVASAPRSAPRRAGDSPAPRPYDLGRAPPATVLASADADERARRMSMQSGGLVQARADAPPRLVMNHANAILSGRGLY